MEAIICGVAGFIAGLVAGSVIQLIRGRSQTAGALRIDMSDPNEGPYLFLELQDGGLEKVVRSDVVSFDVVKENYIARN